MATAQPAPPQEWIFQNGTPEWISRLRLQLELDLEIWKTGGLEDWKTGGLDYCAFGNTLYTQLCLRHGGG